MRRKHCSTLGIIFTVMALYPLSVIGQNTEVPSSDDEGKAGQRPIIKSIKPQGGEEGAIITIEGKKLGDNLKDIKLWLMGKIKNNDKPIEIKPLTLSSPDKMGIQQLGFAIPIKHELARNMTFFRKMWLKFQIRNQPPYYLRLTVVGPKWRWNTLWLTILFILFLLALAFLPQWRQKLWLKLFVDKKTETYSLSKCQAFAWTIVLIGSYFYLAIGQGIILGKETIPEFNQSLLILLGISYGGLLTSKQIGKTSLKNTLWKIPRRSSDLISEGGEISLPRLQQAGFTVTAIFVYIYYLSGADIFLNGLPKMPQTLLWLMGISQTGYLGGKLVGERLAVNQIVPGRIQTGKKNINLTLIGAQFTGNVKVLFQDHSQILDAELLSQNSLALKNIPTYNKPGKKQITVIPNSGNCIIIEDAIEVVEPKIVKIERVKRKKGSKIKLELTLEGFEPQKTKADFGKNREPAELDNWNKDRNTVTLKAAGMIAKGAPITISSLDGALEVVGTAP